MPAYPPLTQKDIEGAFGKVKSEAIPYPDLRKLAKSEHDKQEALTKKGFSPKGLIDAKALEAARLRGKACHQHRIAVQVAFERAFKRATADLQRMAADDPLKKPLASILIELRKSKQKHQDAITEVSNSFVECERKLKEIRAQEKAEHLK